mmetsp:Transcript_12686/g.30344  ORF Transcript_12686/g.30344 Transcript_12686/m.30344 type:complete len:584 (+) Transcript_12686:1447-3198(+)
MSVLAPWHLPHGDHGIQVPLVPVDQHLHVEGELQIQADDRLLLADDRRGSLVVGGVDHGSEGEVRRQLGQDVLSVPGDLPAARLDDEHIALQEGTPESHRTHRRHAGRVGLGARVPALNAHEVAGDQPEIPGVQDVGLGLPGVRIASSLPLVVEGHDVRVTPDSATSGGTQLQGLRRYCGGCGGRRGGGCGGGGRRSVHLAGANTPLRALGLLHADGNLVRGTGVAWNLVLVVRSVDTFVAPRTSAALGDFARHELRDLRVHDVQMVRVDGRLTRLNQLFLECTTLAVVLQRTADHLNSIPFARTIRLAIFNTVAPSAIGPCRLARSHDLLVRRLCLAAAGLVIRTLLTAVLDGCHSSIVELLGHFVRLGDLGVDCLLQIGALCHFSLGSSGELGALVPQLLVLRVLITEVSQQRSNQRLRVAKAFSTGVALVIASNEALRQLHGFAIRISTRAHSELLATYCVVVANKHIAIFETLRKLRFELLDRASALGPRGAHGGQSRLRLLQSALHKLFVHRVALHDFAKHCHDKHLVRCMAFLDCRLNDFRNHALQLLDCLVDTRGYATHLSDLRLHSAELGLELHS